MLAAPCDIHSRFFWLFVSVMPSINESVSKDSISPMPARIRANGRIMPRVSNVKGTSGTLKDGNPPEILDRSPTVGVSTLPKITMAETTSIPASAEGNFEVSLGTR